MPDSFGSLRESFNSIKASVCVPLVTKAGLIGIMILGEKQEENYNQEDFELLETLANHSAIAIQNLKLQEQQHQVKELESFYKMSSFVLHDLRNTVSILSMISKNATMNMDDPEFRSELQTSLAHSVSKMKNLLSRISIAAGDRALVRKVVDINELIEKTIQEISIDQKFPLTFYPGHVSKVAGDQTQLKKVMVNLILNAVEALTDKDEGKIEIITHAGQAEQFSENTDIDRIPGEFVEIIVSDTGCGMSDHFMDTQLFKPFQTTKEMGLGIGLYQCKEIIGLHGGRIWAKSEIGKGSSFHVALPLPKVANGAITFLNEQYGNGKKRKSSNHR